MSDSLRIMVRIKERRVLTREEAYALEAAESGHNQIAIDANEFLISLGMDRSSYLYDPGRAPYGTAIFNTPREATANENDAWHITCLSSLSSMLHPSLQTGEDPFPILRHNKQAVLDARAMLQGKEIILEVVNSGGDADDS